MPETNDRVEMSLDQVIKKDWQGPPASKEGKGEGRPVGKVAAFGKAGLGKGRGAGRGKGGKGGGKAGGKAGGGRGLVRRNPIMTKVRRAPTKGASKSKGKGKIRETRDDWEGGKGKGRREGGKSGGKGKSSGKSTGKSRGKSVVQGLRLWRGAAARSGTTNAETRAGKGGKSKGKGKSPGKSSNILRVTRNPTFLKRSSKGQGKKGGGKALAVSNYNGKGQNSYGKGKSKGKSYNDNGRRGYGGGNSNNYSGNSYGGAYSGGGSWGQERSQDWGYDNYSKGGKGSILARGREMSPRASDQLSVEDKRMMKKITVVAQLDKVPKPHPAMQGLRKRSTGGDTGALSSRFAANFRR